MIEDPKKPEMSPEPPEQGGRDAGAPPAPIGPIENNLGGDGLPDRRSFMRRLFGTSVLAAESAFLLSPWYAADDSFMTDKAAAFKSGHVPYPWTDSIVPLPGGGSFRNLGVMHTDEAFEDAKGLIESAIVKTDVLFIEGPITQVGGNYFEQRCDHALKLGKRVYCVDSYNWVQHIATGWEEIRGIMATGAGVMLGGEAALSAVSREKPSGLLRRSFIRAFGYYGALTGYPSSTLAVSLAAAPDSYPAADVSFVTDARTVMMLDEILKISANHPGAKILAITGDMHAKGFSFYLSGPNAEKLFRAKLAAYDKIYRPTFNNHSTEIGLE